MKKKTPSSGHVNSAKEEVFEESLHFTATLVGCLNHGLSEVSRMPSQWHTLGFVRTSLSKGGCSRIPNVKIELISIIRTYFCSNSNVFFKNNLQINMPMWPYTL